MPEPSLTIIPQLIGIINVSPDSFSGDGMAYNDALQHHLRGCWAMGADVIDIGAESTRPGAVLISAQEEWQRLQSLITMLADDDTRRTFSFDTRHAVVAREILRHLGHIHDVWINDVSAGADPEMWHVIAAHPSCRYVLMHHLSLPADPGNCLADHEDPIAVVMAFAEQRIQQLQLAGIGRHQLLFDPGIGFGKTARQSWEIIRRAAELKKLGLPVVVGHSRKSWLTLFAAREARHRDPETIAASLLLASNGVDYLRVHDLIGHRAAWCIWLEAGVHV